MKSVINVKKFRVLSNIAYRNIFRNFRRSVFSIAAIAIAVFTIIAFISYISGMINSVMKVVQTFDSAQISVFTKDYEINKDFQPLQYPLEYAGGNIGTLKNKIERIEGVKKAFPRISTTATLTDSLVKHAIVWGIDFENESKINHFNITDNTDGIIIGRPFEKANDQRSKNECLVGINLAVKLRIIKEVIELDEWEKMISNLTAQELNFIKDCYTAEKNVYRLSIGKMLPVRIAKKGDKNAAEIAEKTKLANKIIYEKQLKLLDLFIRNADNSITMKIISSQYSDKFLKPRIVGIFNFDYEKYDSNMIILPFDLIQRAASLSGKTQTMAVYLEKQSGIDKISKEIEGLFPAEKNTVVKKWIDDPMIVYYNQLKIIYAFIYVFFVVLASFLIINTIIMIIYERIKEIGMMGSLGMKKDEIVIVFFLEAVFLSVIGSLIGTVISGIFTFLMSFYPIKFLELTGGIDFPISNTIFIDFSPFHLVQGFLIGVIISGFCTIIPSMTSVRVEPVEALRR